MPKYRMPKEDNVFFAKRMLVDSVYKSAHLEGIAVTFASTNDILNDVNVENIKPSDMTKVFCLRDAWKYLIDHIDAPMNLGFLEELHSLIARADVEYGELGQLRKTDVMISGTRWRPELPDAARLHTSLQALLETQDPTDRALSVTLFIMRSQMFRDGNKRVATLAGNKILIENGCGILAVPIELDGRFKSMLVEYYESDDMESIKNWMVEHCIDGVNIPCQAVEQGETEQEDWEL